LRQKKFWRNKRNSETAIRKMRPKQRNSETAVLKMRPKQRNSETAIFIKILHSEFACSTLTLCHLSRAILSMNLRWVRGPTLTRAKVEFPSKKIKKNRFFFQEKFPSILGTGCPKIGHRRFGHRTARHPKNFIILFQSTNVISLMSHLYIDFFCHLS